MADQVKQIDFAQAAQSAVDIGKELDDAISKYSPTMNYPRLFQIRVKARWLLDSERLTKYTFDYLPRTSLVKDKVPAPNDTVFLYFNTKVSAKFVREIVDQDFFSKVYRDPARNPDDHSMLCQVELGPDHKRVTGRIE